MTAVTAPCTLSHEAGIYELALHGPPCNEIGTTMLSALEDVLTRLDPAQGRALIIHSSLKSGFSAGADLRELHQGLVDRPEALHGPEIRAFLDRTHAVMNALDLLPMTTIAAIHGVCFGGGFELALTADLRVCDKTARFAFPELRLGVIPGFGGIPRLRRDVGNGLVRDLLLTGRSINAKKALDVGLAAQLVAPGQALEVARSMARQAIKFDPDAMTTCKRFMKPLPLAELELEKDHFVRLAQGPVLRAALDRFTSSTDVRPYLP